MPAWFLLVISGVAAVAGAIAAVASAGVDSLITPALSLRIDMHDAVLAVTAPHLAFNALRCWTLRSKIDGKIFRRFGVTSAVGSIAGALLHNAVSSGWITGTFAALLAIAGVFGLTGYAERVHIGRRGAYAGGVISGFFGGLTGEQGGLRAAAMLGLGISKEAFVATATASALVVDAVRIPVYLITRVQSVPKVAVASGISVVGVIFGMLVGERLLHKVPEHRFSQVVSGVLLLIGVLLGLRLFLGH